MSEVQTVTQQQQETPHSGFCESIPEAMRAWSEWHTLYATPDDQRVDALFHWLQTRHERRNAVASEILRRLGALVQRRLILEATTTRRAEFQSRLLAIVERMDSPLQPDNFHDLMAAFRTVKDEAVRQQIVRIIAQRRF